MQLPQAAHFRLILMRKPLTMTGIRWSFLCRVLTCLCLLISINQSSCRADPVRYDKGAIASRLNVPVYQWQDDSASPGVVVIAIHGLLMHAGTFDAMARNLCERGCVVFAPDMRGYGRWYDEDYCHSPESCVNYKKSETDLVKLVEAVKDEYPDRPVFLIGESLGADMALRLVSHNPDLVNGVVLSSPAIKRRTLMLRKTLVDGMIAMANPKRELDMTPYIRSFASDDPRITEEIVEDPLSRKKMSAWELLKSRHMLVGTMSCVGRICPSVPVLIIQGSQDRTLKANAVVLLLSKLKSYDQTVRWFPQKGHILLETSFIDPYTMNIVAGWLEEHATSKPLYRSASSIREEIIRTRENKSGEKI